jgi:uncharacterized protein (DUF58 family)
MARPFQAWLDARMPRGEEAVLTHRCVYILPTRQGLFFALVLVLLLIGSINYAIGLGFAFTFLLAGLGLVSMLHAYRNLAGLVLRPGKAEAVFAGQSALLCLRAENSVPRFALAAQVEGGQETVADIPVGGGELLLPFPAARRGVLRPGKLRLATLFPLGLFRAWSWAAPDLSCLVYPAPEEGNVPLPPGAGESAGGSRLRRGQDDFGGLREYRPGDSPRHVAWKAAARGERLLTKEFAGEAGRLLWLDWHDLAALDAEARLSRLTRWVLDADGAGLAYGLRLPGQEFGPAQGEAHRRACLTALALFGLEEGA